MRLHSTRMSLREQSFPPLGDHPIRTRKFGLAENRIQLPAHGLHRPSSEAAENRRLRIRQTPGDGSGFLFFGMWPLRWNSPILTARRYFFYPAKVEGGWIISLSGPGKCPSNQREVNLRRMPVSSSFNMAPMIRRKSDKAPNAPSEIEDSDIDLMSSK